jgi:hypothetical protein
LQLESGGSVVAQCTSEGLLLTVYPYSTSCSGSYQQEVEPVNQCLQSNGGDYVYNSCPDSVSVSNDRTPKFDRVDTSRTFRLPKHLKAKLDAQKKQH